MAKAPKSPQLRHALRFEREQSIRIAALAYLVLSMSNTKLWVDSKKDHTEGMVNALKRKRKQFIKVTEALVKSVLREYKEYEEKL